MQDARIAYAGSTLDRASHRRIDASWLDARLRDEASVVVPLWRDRSLIAEDARPRAVTLNAERAAAALTLADEPVFLGLDEEDRAWFACDLSRHDEDRLTGLSDGARFQDLGRVITVLGRGDGARLAYARAILHWHRRHRFCGACGQPTRSSQGGHMRECDNPDCRTQHFPRTDPVVIMLVTRSDVDGGACLLARQKQWMPGLMSALAGFVEPGETLEEAVRREVREETALELGQVLYWTSQPWPFPYSLMLGFRAETTNADALLPDRTELEDARWFGRREVAEIRAAGFRLPFRGTIARALIEAWLAEAPAGGEARDKQVLHP
ncbi:MAG: NAD(+) diphosphatase [Defluviicoccus sp.]|nr:MAG: NAD(+) diphosphatase [Defluviicoccus sp.]